MIPLADENPSGKKPYVVYGLLALNILVYLVEVVTTQQIARGFSINALWNWQMVPAALFTNGPVEIKFSQFVLHYNGLQPQWLTIFTSMFMHGGFMHIAGNMLYLWIFGNNIEDALGHVKFLLFYLACGVLASLAHAYSNTQSMIPTLGASGAIAGVLGAYLFLYPRNYVRTLLMLGWFWDYVEIPAMIVLGGWFVLQLVGLGASGSMQGGGVAYWAHVGGFVAGIVLIIILGGRRLRGQTRQFRRYRKNLSQYED